MAGVMAFFNAWAEGVCFGDRRMTIQYSDDVGLTDVQLAVSVRVGAERTTWGQRLPLGTIKAMKHPEDYARVLAERAKVKIRRANGVCLSGV